MNTISTSELFEELLPEQPGALSSMAKAFSMPRLTDPLKDRERPLKIPLLGSTSGFDMRELFFSAQIAGAFGKRPIDWFDPREGFTHINDPAHYMAEVGAMYTSDLRVSVVHEWSLGVISLREIHHMLSNPANSPLVVHIAPAVAPEVAESVEPIEVAYSNNLRATTLAVMDQHDGMPIVHRAESIWDAVIITAGIVKQWQ